MEPGYVAGLVLIGYILIQVQVADCINCLNCKNIDDLSNCNDVIHCNEDEVCYIDKVFSPDSLTALYNTGCRSTKYCILDLCNKQAYGDANSRKKRQSGSGEILTLCSECCFEETCNTKGCGYVHHPKNVSQCYSCKEVYEGGPPCTRTEDCDLKLFSCSVTLTQKSQHAPAYDLGCKYKRDQCRLLLALSADQQDPNVKCCDTPLCNTNPYHRKVNKTAVALNFSCPTGIARPTTTPLPTTTTTELPTTQPPLPSTTEEQTTKPPLPTSTTAGQSSVHPTFTPGPPNSTDLSTGSSPMATNASTTATPTTQSTTPVPTTPTTTKATTTTIKTTTTTKSSQLVPQTLPPVTTKCAVCSGPKFLCEKLFASTPCTAPNNYCINTISNHRDGTRSVDRHCGDFNECYREWFQGSSDNDKCRKFTGNEEQRLEFQCTFCCTKDNCNTNLHPPENTLYKPH